MDTLNMSKRFTTTLLEDDFGDLQLTIPYDICEEFGWDATTEFEYEMDDEVRYISNHWIDEVQTI